MVKYMVSAPVQGTSREVRDDVQGARSSQSGLDSPLVTKSGPAESFVDVIR